MAEEIVINVCFWHKTEELNYLGEKLNRLAYMPTRQNT